MAPLKVIGAGYGRTGTLSLCHALEILGFSCHHMESMLLDPAQKPELFAQAYHSRTCDWDRALSGYDAAVDWPCAEFWEELATEYPDAKIILTVRDPEAWYASVGKTIQNWPMCPELEWPQHMLSGRAMARTIVREGVLQNFHDKDAMIKQFVKHIERVKRTIPADRLLVFNATDGWEPLCRFLGKDMPTTVPYPHSNRGQNFEARLLWVREHVLQNRAARTKDIFPEDALALKNGDMQPMVLDKIAAA